MNLNYRRKSHQRIVRMEKHESVESIEIIWDLLFTWVILILKYG